MANVWYSAIQRKLPISISTSFPILKTSNMLTKKKFTPIVGSHLLVLSLASMIPSLQA